MLLYLSDLIIGIPQVVKILNQFGTFSGYKLNFSKSVCFLINNKGLHISSKDIPFQLSVSGFKYLGINITQALPNLYKVNFAPLIDKLKLDLKRWNLMFLSLAGRINCEKMNILPRFLYLFQCIPIFLPKSFFQYLDRLILHLYGAEKHLGFRWNFSKDKKLFIQIAPLYYIVYSMPSRSKHPQDLVSI